ncbi:MAG: hypothetical protein IPM76_12505 [Chloroflexi bacterium]|nr:hypothetical protein [Chloroflexota bacterium]
MKQCLLAACRRTSFCSRGILTPPLEDAVRNHGYRYFSDKLLDGTGTFCTLNLTDDVKPGQTITVKAVKADGTEIVFDTLCRIDTPVEVDYYRNGGILHTVLRNFLKE